MSKYGLKIALEHANNLPKFESQKLAEESLLQLRNDMINFLLDFAKKQNISLDFSPESLKTLEKWYFQLYNNNQFKPNNIDINVFEHSMGFYYAYIFTKNNQNFKWFVEESPFIKDKYEIGITKGLMTIMVGSISHLHKLKNNKRMQSIYRDYKQYSA